MAPAIGQLASGHTPGNEKKAPRSPAGNTEASNRAAPRTPSGRNHNGIPALPLQKASDRSHTVGQNPGFDDNRYIIRCVDKPGEQRLNGRSVEHSHPERGARIKGFTHPTRARRPEAPPAQTRAQEPITAVAMAPRPILSPKTPPMRPTTATAGTAEQPTQQARHPSTTASGPATARVREGRKSANARAVVVRGGSEAFASSSSRCVASSSFVVRRGRAYNVPEGTAPRRVDKMRCVSVAEATRRQNAGRILQGAGSWKKGERPEGLMHMPRYTRKRCTASARRGASSWS